MWSQDSGDSLASPPSSSEIVSSYGSYPEKTIVLNHETKSLTVNEVMPRVIPNLKQKGFSFKTVIRVFSLVGMLAWKVTHH
ncbi:hypothetical protein PGTUg99_010767 [Puccinia graminis f. sp. tritici]|uniref:Uncharacterized protein n=1 Tax=Puccinia graminis f. sp. tritici TaxID=56615 RepID=A0A5B0MRW3_PUCGR|nr:hypothetical protein PGTUg99_010767 [Puccinia graminis f. sp. tritici]